MNKMKNNLTNPCRFFQVSCKAMGKQHVQNRNDTMEQSQCNLEQWSACKKIKRRKSLRRKKLNPTQKLYIIHKKYNID